MKKILTIILLLNCLIAGAQQYSQTIFRKLLNDSELSTIISGVNSLGITNEVPVGTTNLQAVIVSKRSTNFVVSVKLKSNIVLITNISDSGVILIQKTTSITKVADITISPSQMTDIINLSLGNVSDLPVNISTTNLQNLILSQQTNSSDWFVSGNIK